MHHSARKISIHARLPEGHDETWKRFTQLAAQTKSQVQQTAIAFLAPPNQRTKARYMNLEILVRWSQRALVVLDQIEQRTDTRESHEKIKTKLGWLTEFREPVKEWNALCQSAITAECFVRKHGLWNGCELELTQCFDPGVASSKTLQFREQLLDFVKTESLKAQPEERLLASSEIIESVLGKMKRLEQDQAKSGFYRSGIRDGCDCIRYNPRGGNKSYGNGANEKSNRVDQGKTRSIGSIQTEYCIFYRSECGTKTGSITRLGLSGFSSAQSSTHSQTLP